jgi:hypothetical protein
MFVFFTPTVSTASWTSAGLYALKLKTGGGVCTGSGMVAFLQVLFVPATLICRRQTGV